MTRKSDLPSCYLKGDLLPWVINFFGGNETMRTTLFPLSELLSMGFDSQWGHGHQSSGHEEGLEVSETEQGHFLMLDLPGVTRENLSISIEDQTLGLKATRSRTLPGVKTKKWNINKRFTLPKDVKTEEISAKMEDGVLYLSLPKVERKTQQILVGPGHHEDWVGIEVEEKADS